MSKEENDKLKQYLRIIVRNLGIVEKNEASCCGITKTKYQTIAEIGKKPKISLIDLSNTLGVDKSTMSRTIDNLVEENFVQRSWDDEKRRYIIIQLTEKGTATSESCEESIDVYYSDLMESIPVEKRSQVLESLALIADAVKKLRSGQQGKVTIKRGDKNGD
jgi:DNA-binding MarR family transcriptional regulator